jgi:hypothetical protein
LDEHHYLRFEANKKTFTFRQMGDTGEWVFHYSKLLDQLPNETTVKNQLLDFLVDCDDYDDEEAMVETCMKLAVGRGYTQFTRNSTVYRSCKKNSLAISFGIYSLRKIARPVAK